MFAPGEHSSCLITQPASGTTTPQPHGRVWSGPPNGGHTGDSRSSLPHKQAATGRVKRGTYPRDHEGRPLDAAARGLLAVQKVKLPTPPRPTGAPKTVPAAPT